MRSISLFVLATALWLLSGCSTKEFYKPQSVKDDWPTAGYLGNAIVDTTFDGAVLENGQVITRQGIADKKVPHGYRFISQSDGWIIAGQTDGKLLLLAEKGTSQHMFELSKTVAAATVKGDILAVLFANNEMALYSIESAQPLLKEQGNPPVAVDNRIVNPFFLNELVLFATLDGKIVIINSQTKKVLRSMIVSSEEHFNNIIYFNIIGNKMVAATSYRILALADKEVRTAYELRDIVYDDDGIWISTKQGEVVALTPSLQVKAKQKFPFAHFLGMIVTEKKVYLLEKQGYLIVLEKDLSNFDVYDADIEEGYVFVSDKAFYFDDAFLKVE